MSIFDIFSRHPRGDISAQADGELAPEHRETLEAHLAGCERCRTELDDLLSLRSALSSLPQVAAPRSFTLTPAMAEREPRPVTPRATPSFVAMRVAGAGFAAVLAVVVMLDAGGIIDDTGGGNSDESPTALSEADLTNRGLAADGSAEFDAAPEASGGEIPGNLATTAPADGDGGLPASGDDAGAFGGIGSGPGADGGDPALDPLPDNPVQDTSDITTTAGDAEKALTPESGDAAITAFAPEDDSTNTLLVIEIGLAAIAVLAIGGSFVMRRRAESE